MMQFERLPERTRFRLTRIAARLTLFDVGQAADVAPPRLSEFERGEGTLQPEVLARVRAVLEAATYEQEGPHAA